MPRPAHDRWRRPPRLNRPTALIGPSERCPLQRAARVRRVTSQDLDVVVLGGGGHVGLPLSLSLAKAGLRVGVYDTNQATLERISSWGNAVPRERRRRAPSRAPTDRPAGARRGCRDDRPHRPADRGRWNAGRRIPGTLDDHLREDRRPDRAASPGRRARRLAQHGLSGHDGLRSAASGCARLQGRRRVLSRAHRGRARSGRAAFAAADHRCR